MTDSPRVPEAAQPKKVLVGAPDKERPDAREGLTLEEYRKVAFAYDHIVHRCAELLDQGEADRARMVLIVNPWPLDEATLAGLRSMEAEGHRWLHRWCHRSGFHKSHVWHECGNTYLCEGVPLDDSQDSPRPERALTKSSSVGVSGSASDEGFVSAADSAARVADFLRRLSEWDALNLLPIEAPYGDAPYWQREITKARADLSALIEAFGGRLVGLSADVSRRDDEIEALMRRCRALQDEFAGAEARVAVLREALKQIADPTYIGNYELFDVVEIYRKWAKSALDSATSGAGEAEA